MGSHYNQLSFELLQRDKNAFILACQPLIEIIVKKYIGKGMFRLGDYQDIIQTVNEILINKLPTIENQYNGSVLLSTYLSVVIRNICFSQLKRHQHISKMDDIDQHDFISEPDIEYKLYINDEINRLKNLYQLYFTNKSKLIICTKVYFKLPISYLDRDTLLADIDESTHSLLVQHFGKDFNNTYESNNFDLLSIILNKTTGTHCTGDSLRKWTERKIHEIIYILNGNPPRYSYDMKTFRDLFEFYCFRYTSNFN